MADYVNNLYLIRNFLKLIFQSDEKKKKIQGKIITFSAVSLAVQL
jgi:hypothetical protein